MFFYLIIKKIQTGCVKIVANRGKYNRRVVAKLYSSFCNHYVLCASDLFSLLNNGKLNRIWINYFKFCKFFLVRKFSVPDITLKLEILHRKLQYSFCVLIPSPSSYPFFLLFYFSYGSNMFRSYLSYVIIK